MNTLIFILILVFNTYAQASQTYTIKTGYAYITCNGVNTGPIELPIGAQYTPSDGCTLIEVANQTALEAITFAPPMNPDKDQIALNQKALAEIIANQIANDPALEAQQKTINTEYRNK